MLRPFAFKLRLFIVLANSAILLLLCMAFGGMYEGALPWASLGILLFACYLPPSPRNKLPIHSLCWLLFSFSLYSLAFALSKNIAPGQLFEHSLAILSEHPLLILSPFLFLAFFSIQSFVPNLWIAYSLLVVGAALASCAIGHWFQDNGLLFHTFAPENIFRSYRARWPFVNPNHLAEALLIPTSLASAFFYIRSIRLLEGFQKREFQNFRAFLIYALEHRVQKRISSLFSILLLLLLLIIAIFASASRIGMLCALCIVFANLLFAFPFFSHTHSLHPAKSRIFLSLTGASFLGLAAIVYFLFQSSQKASELLHERIVIGFASSFEDLRFLLWRKSLPLVFDNPVFGIGLGNWNKAFAAIQPDELAGIDPEYLHNEALQTLIEQGICGCLLILALALLTVIAWRKAYCHPMTKASSIAKQTEYLCLRSAYGIGLIAVCITSLFDFPFRIPGVAILFVMAWVALLIPYREGESGEGSG
jgi:O-antigen ligase